MEACVPRCETGERTPDILDFKYVRMAAYLSGQPKFRNITSSGESTDGERAIAAAKHGTEGGHVRNDCDSGQGNDSARGAENFSKDNTTHDDLV